MTIFWYDYETFGANPYRDRPAQFAGVRTDEHLNILSEPVEFYCRPAPDYLPVPEACLVHGISPIELLKKGVPASQFAAAIHAELSVPDTCSVGFNAIAFDHEITRFLLYRNLLDPYAWHYENGCSRWDIIDLLRAAYALKPDGINWPRREDGAPSFRLEDLARANGIIHEAAHDARSDILTTVKVAALVKKTAPDLFAHYFRLRKKNNVFPFLRRPSLFVSSYIAAADGCTTLVAPVSGHPASGQGVIVYDLRRDPQSLADLSSEELRELLFAKKADLPEGVERPPLFRIKANACPFLAHPRLADHNVQQRLGLDLDLCRRNYKKLQQLLPSIEITVSDAYVRDWPKRDADEALYDRFIPNADRALLHQLLTVDAWDGGCGPHAFSDPRLAELVFRYQARNHGRSLSPERLAVWKAHCRSRHLTEDESGPCRLDRYERDIAALRVQRDGDVQVSRILDELSLYGSSIRKWLA